MYKRIAVLTVLFAVLCSLSGCIYFEVDRTYELMYEVNEIEFIYIHYTPEGYIESDSIPAEVAASEFESFTSELKQIPFKQGYLIVLAAVDPSFGFGDYTVEIKYKNGGYDIISDCGYQEYCDASGKLRGRHYGCESEDWEAFIHKYLPEE